jgi:CxxC motif-containing protein (DUF1111 family)
MLSSRITALPCAVAFALLAGAAHAESGDPLPNLTAEQLAQFQDGRRAFQVVETVADGLGPVFNESSCVACHLGPGTAVGGSNQRLETRFGRIRLDGSFDPLTELGGSLIQDHAIAGFLPEVVPRKANVVASRRTTPLFGLGLVDAVPDSTYRFLALTQAIFSPSTAGTASIVTDPVSGRQNAVGKFGWKGQVPSLFVFSADAYLNEMGITSPLFPNESCPQGDCTLLVGSTVPQPNDDGDDVARFNDFMTFLAPPPRGPQSLLTDYGNLVASSIGCLDCHTQSLTTGSNAVTALNQVTFHPFSDFLLHDMGSLGDGITQNRATGRLMRTAPLWGLRTQARLLHDGRATTIEQAIQGHEGQGAAARNRFRNLGSFDRATLLAFLRSL